MNEESPQLMNESLKDESFIGANNSTGKKHYESNFMLYKFESPLHKSTNLTTSLKGLLTSRKDIEKKYSNAYFKVEKLKKEYEQEIGKINGLRKQSLSLYKFKKYADEWNQQVIRQ